MLRYYPSSNGKPSGTNLDIYKTNNPINNFYTNKGLFVYIYIEREIEIDTETYMHIHIY